MNYIKSICLFILLSSLSVISNAEYLIYKKLPKHKISHLSAKEHSQAYEILMKYQFPMNTISSMTKSEICEYSQVGEITFLEGKLKKHIDSSVEIVFVPTALYELFCIYCALEKKNNFYEVKNFSFENMENNIFNNGYTKCIFSLLYDEKLKKYHFNINDLLLIFLFDGGISIKNLTQDLFNKKYLYLLSQIKSLANSNTNNTNYNNYSYYNDKFYNLKLICKNDCDSKKNKEIGINSIKMEIEAEKDNRFLLFRGTQTGGDKIDFNGGHHDLSYGNSLFAGSFNCSGACAYYYIAYYNRPGSVVFLSKSEFLKRQGDEFDIFYISPLNTLLSLMGSGCLFHSRSKMPKEAVLSYCKKSNYKHLSGIFYVEQQMQVLSEHPLNLIRISNYEKNKDFLNAFNSIKKNNYRPILAAA